MEAFRSQSLLHFQTAMSIIQEATELLEQEPNLISIQSPVLVCGDTHGQYFDLIEIFRLHGLPSSTQTYLFLGDYVDRGNFSCEIMLTLLALKSKYPQNIFLLRGNHECKSVSTFYGFQTECESKYGNHVYNRFIYCFQALPLAATIHTSYGTYLAVHGGLSPEWESLQDLNTINRFVEPEENSFLCDLLWSDPDREASSDVDWKPNNNRGCSYFFSLTTAQAFLQRNDLLSLIRAHEVEEEGYCKHFGTSEIPPVITVFSAPNYCNSVGNQGALLSIGTAQKDFQVHQYTHVPRVEPIKWSNDWHAIQKAWQSLIPFFPSCFHTLVQAAKIVGPAPKLTLTTRKPAAAPNETTVYAKRRPSVDALHGKRPVKELLRRWEPQRYAAESEQCFTLKQVECLQLVFQYWDRTGQQQITMDDLEILAIEEDGYAASSELTICIDAMDADKDGSICPLDFLQFALRLKKQHGTTPLVA